MDDNTILLFGSKNHDNWATPKSFYEELDKEFNFTMDPCPLNSKVDGLKVPWNGSVFVNPPYSNVIDWFKKAHEEIDNCDVIVFLVFANTDTKWFHDYVYNKAEIRFIRGRLKFGGVNKDGVVVNNSAMRPSMLVIFKK